jgi:hypothetical protein
MTKPTVKEHIKAGRQSAFPWCCVIWFFIRKFVLFSVLKVSATKVIERMRKDKVRAMHVPCPLHWTKYRLTGDPVYVSCINCRWMQLEDPICRRCK